MQIDPIQRSVQLSVRELAIFRNHPTARGHGRSPWRAMVGQQWHQVAAKETQATESEVRLEQPVNCTWRHRGWEFCLRGRIDQLIPLNEGHYLIREVKTIRSPLPSADETLLQTYPDYFAQVSIYQNTLAYLPEYAGREFTAEVQFINIENGARQSVALGPPEQALFEQQLDALWQFLEISRDRRLRIRESDFGTAFPSLRPGQAELLATLQEAALRSKTVLLQAPTGFGKTGIVLEHALKQMQAGLYDRCIYLSSKATGQLETIRQLRQMAGDSVHYLQMRNRREHQIESPAHTCTGDERCNEGLEAAWQRADLDVANCFADGTVTLEHAQSIGRATGVCPYAISKASLPYADVWIGDSNYVFSPESRPVFDEVAGFDPARTLLIVDEAHNLPDRSAESLSVEMKAGELLFAVEELRERGASRRLLKLLEELVRWIERLTPSQALNSNDLYSGLDLCEECTRQLEASRLDYEATARFAIDLIWRIPGLTHCLAAPAHEYLNWVPERGVFRATCLDPSVWIRQCLQPFGGSILMSATLDPCDAFAASCGLTAEMTTLAHGHAPWREGAYDVVVDCRVDTRLRQRAGSYETTAGTVVHAVRSRPGEPIVVFFSSYQYADNVLAYAEALDPGIRIQRQPRGGNLSERSQFIEESLLTADAIFLILGSSYAEGIDQLGGRVELVLIVGPALPEVNRIQQTKVEQHDSLDPADAFRAVYIRPAMRRIHQALGRLVRAPGHRARVILHGKRFAQADYAQELAPEYQPTETIHSEAELIEWLNQAHGSETANRDLQTEHPPD